MNKINLENHGDGIWSDYSKQDSRLTIYYQIPTLEQLKFFKIKEFNEGGYFTEGIDGKKITKETYEIYLKNLTQSFKYDPNPAFFSEKHCPYSYLGEYLEEEENYPLDLIRIYEEPPVEIILESLDKIIPFKNKEEESDSEFLLQLKTLEFSSSEDIYEHYDLYDDTGKQLVLYACGWKVSKLQEEDNFYLKVEFQFNKRVNSWFANLKETGSISLWSQDWMEGMTHMAYSSFNLDDYITIFRKRHTYYFEKNIDLKNFPETEIY